MRWAGREYSARARLLVLVPQLLLVFGLLPLFILVGGPVLDRHLGLAPLGSGTATAAVGSAATTVGAAFVVWGVYAQYTRGRGTPAPVVPTQDLVVDGPYRYTRNPLVFGAGLYFFGVAVLVGSGSGVAFAAGFVAVQAGYVKVIEERELAARFGEAYRDYRRRTPFLLPRPPRRDGE